MSTITEEDEGDSDFDKKSVDSAQQDLDVISREPQEFTHPIHVYQVLESQSNQQAEQTLGLVHTKQSLRNVKASVASAKAGKLKEIIEKTKKPSSSSVAEKEREGMDEATLRLIEIVRRETEQEQKLQTDIKQEPFTEEELVNTSCGVPGFSMDKL